MAADLLITGLRFRHASGFAVAIDSLRIAPGEVVALSGPSGSGKSTVLALIAGILRPAAGRIRIADREFAGDDDRARRRFRLQHIGQVPQELDLLPWLTVLDNVLLPVHLGAACPDAPGRAAGLLAGFGLGDQQHRLPGELSLGERQRVAVARALLPGPALLLADEPTASLDPHHARQVMDALLDSARQHAVPALVVCHDPALSALCDRRLDARSWQESRP